MGWPLRTVGTKYPLARQEVLPHKIALFILHKPGPNGCEANAGKICLNHATESAISRVDSVPWLAYPPNLGRDTDALASLAITDKEHFMAKGGWSLEGELCRLANTPDLAIAFAKLGFGADGQDLPQLRMVMDWHRSGAETYSYTFATLDSSNNERRYRLKACVSWGPNATIEDIIKLWIQRRSVLAAEGVSVPRLVASGSGLILEEEIPHHVSMALQSVSSERVLAQLLNIAAAIARLRFLPVN
ncbi:MAG: hypothetical protein FWD08_07100, partial [Alphaproteobacteria bacterium]|nr:hypothetical protein [Alphaproteobacteria bacterium]